MKIFLSVIITCSYISLYAQVNFNATEACYGLQTVFVATSDSGDAVISSWNWDMNNDGQYNGEYDAPAGKMTGFNFAEFATQADTFPVTLKVILNSGDSMLITKNVVVYPLPQVNFEVDNLCEGKPATYINKSSIAWGTIDEIKWDFNNDGVYDDISNSDTVAYTCGPASTYITKLRCASDKQCASIAAKTTQVFHQPAAAFSVQNTCVGGIAQFVNASSVQNENMSFLLWSFGDGTQATTGGNTSHAYSAQQSYTVQLVAVSENFCNDTLTKTITISQLVNTNFTIQNECLGGTTNFINNTAIDSSETLASLQWNFGDATTGTTSGSVSHNYAATGNYVVTLTATTLNGCVNTTTDTVNIAQKINAGFTSQNACMGEITAFSNTSTTSQGEIISTLLWNYGDGNSGTSNSHEYAATGTYNVTLVAVSQNECKDTASASVTVNPNPVVSLEISGDTINDSTFYKGDNITLTVSGNANAYLWNNNKITGSITVSEGGAFSVTATNTGGCSQILTKKIIMKEVPDTASAGNDIITPNGDGINDVFIIQDVSGYNQCTLNIFNIWNEEVYSNTGYKNDWEGKDKSGKELDAGAYFYMLKCDDKPQTIGTVNVLR